MNNTARAFEKSYSYSLSAQPFLRVAVAPSQAGHAMTISRRLANKRPIFDVGLACLY